MLLAWAKALQAIPGTLAANAGAHPAPLLHSLLAAHRTALRSQPPAPCYSGVSPEGSAADMRAVGVLEPLSMVESVLSLATETACLIATL